MALLKLAGCGAVAGAVPCAHRPPYYAGHIAARIASDGRRYTGAGGIGRVSALVAATEDEAGRNPGDR